MVDHPPQPAGDDKTKAQDRRRLLLRLAAAGALVLGLMVVLLLACVLWIPRWLYPPLTETDLRGVSDAAKVQELKGARLKLQNDARTTLLQGLAAVLVLTGAGIGAAVTLRQIKVNQEQLQTTRQQMRHTLETTQNQLHLTEQGQLTDRYTKAVEQLGHEKAAVRLSALYSLEHLAQDNPGYRRPVVDVLCAYLRVAYTPPAWHKPGAEQGEHAGPPADDLDQAPHRVLRQDSGHEELQVRLTAQRILATHLHVPWTIKSEDAQLQLRPPSPDRTFWPQIRLDLTGATLVNLDFTSVSIASAHFEEATFHGDTHLGGATFHSDAQFGRATFHGDAHFGGVTFVGEAEFGGATFIGNAHFGGRFKSGASFDGATFWGTTTFRTIFETTAEFSGAIFHGEVDFYKRSFGGDAKFTGTHFQGSANFTQADFKESVSFEAASFGGEADFSSAKFKGYETIFDRSSFEDVARFDEAIFQSNVRFDKTRVLCDTPVLRSVWPDGYRVRRDLIDPTRGLLVPTEYEEPEPAAAPPDQTGR